MAELKIALAGNPNCGKTTLFNALTGSRQYVGNWPGVTVEKKDGRLKGHDDVIIQDLPGIYSLSPYTLEEVVSRRYLVTQRPDVILNIVDGTNIERNLYLTTQLMEVGIPVVIAVNMMDIVRKNGDVIDIKKLSKKLSVPAIEISALKGENVMDAAELAIRTAKSGKPYVVPEFFTGTVKDTLDQIEDLLKGTVDPQLLRYCAVKVFERDSKFNESKAISKETLQAAEKLIRKAEKELDDDAESIITNQRYDYIADVVKEAVRKQGDKHRLSVSDKIDRIVTNRFLGLPIFFVIMLFIYAVSMGGANGDFGSAIGIGTIGTNWVNDVLFGELVPGWMDSLLLGVLHLSDAGVVYNLIQNGIIAGVGAVLGFIPQMLVLFLCLAILEDIGYMSRVAFVMDRIFRQFGLSGKSFIPMLVSTGCGVPGVMSTRTIENEKDRRLTVMTTTFIPCGAKMPIIGLVAGAMFGGSSLVAVSCYFVGMASIVLSGIILKKFKAFAGEPSPFVMELPAYHVPSFSNVLRTVGDRGLAFIKRAGSVIVLSTTIIWFLQSFGVVAGHFTYLNEDNWDAFMANETQVEQLADSMGVPEDELTATDASLLADIAQPVSVIFTPQGFNSWKPTVATISGLVAKENVVGTIGVLYNYDDANGELSDDGEQIWTRFASDFTPLSAYAFLLFNLLCAPCFAAIGAIKYEMNDPKWTAGAITYMCVWAYSVSMMVYQIGGLFSGEVAFSGFTVAAFIMLAALVYLLLRKGYQPDESSQNLTSVQAAGEE